MATMIIELPSHESQAEFNLKRWEELLHDPYYNKLEGRVETDRFGRVIMSPPPGADHGDHQLEVGHLLRVLMKEGRVTTECPISTADGIKAGDIAWASPACLAERGNRGIYPRAPEICVEILSPSNTRREIDEKGMLYFNAGAQEVWICKAGKLSFFAPGMQPLERSVLCPEFPKHVKLA